MTKRLNKPGHGQDAVLDTVDISEASKRLKVSPETIRKRLQRGSLPGFKASNGTWRVTLDTVQDSPGQEQDKPGQADSDLVRRLEDEVAFLRAQLQARDEEIRRAHVLIQQAQAKVPELPAPAARPTLWKRLFG